jgi:hypothetical protein
MPIDTPDEHFGLGCPGSNDALHCSLCVEYGELFGNDEDEW